MASSPAKAGDPVFQSGSDGIEKLRRTGYPACAGYDGIYWGWSCEPRPLLQFRRRGTVEHLAPGAVEQIERVGFDRQRSALARELRHPLDPREHVLQIRPCAR